MSTPKIIAIAATTPPIRTNGRASSAMSPPNTSFNRSRGSIRTAPSTQNTRRNGSRTTQKMAFSTAANATITATIATPNNSSAPSSIIGSMCGHTNPGGPPP